MDDLPIDGDVVIPAGDLSWTAGPSSGPGGQHVNKVATRVDLRLDLPSTAALTEDVKARLREAEAGRLDADGRLRVVCQAHRSQRRNLAEARERLAALVRAALAPPADRKPTRPSAAQKARRLADKRRAAERKRARGPVQWPDDI